MINSQCQHFITLLKWFEIYGVDIMLDIFILFKEFRSWQWVEARLRGITMMVAVILNWFLSVTVSQFRKQQCRNTASRMWITWPRYLYYKYRGNRKFQLVHCKEGEVKIWIINLLKSIWDSDFGGNDLLRAEHNLWFVVIL